MRWIQNEPFFAYETTGEVTCFTDYRDPNSRKLPVFKFDRPETFNSSLPEGKKLKRLFS